MDQISPSDFDQQFELENLFDLISGLVIECLRTDTLQGVLLAVTARQGNQPRHQSQPGTIWLEPPSSRG